MTYEDSSQELRTVEVSGWKLIYLTANGSGVDEIDCAVDVNLFDHVNIIDMLCFAVHGLFHIGHDL